MASGLAAISTVVHLLRPGDEIIAVDDIYKGTTRYFHIVAEVCQIIISASPMNDMDALRSQISEKTKVISLNFKFIQSLNIFFFIS